MSEEKEESYAKASAPTMIQPQYAMSPATVGMGASPITMQPGAPQLPQYWAAAPVVLPNCPPGLEFLHGRDHIVIKEKQQAIEYFVAIELPNRYSIQAPTGEQLYFMAEEPRYLQAEIMGSNRGYRMQVIDGYNRVAFTIHCSQQFCKWACCAFCECCQKTSTVQGAGMKFGSINTRATCCNSKLSLNDEHGKVIILIDGPCCCQCCADVDFQLKSATNGANVGSIKRKYKGCLRSAYTKTNEFHIKFPADMDVRTKAHIIGACIQIDFQQFENDKHNREQR